MSGYNLVNLLLVAVLALNQFIASPGFEFAYRAAYFFASALALLRFVAAPTLIFAAEHMSLSAKYIKRWPVAKPLVWLETFALAAIGHYWLAAAAALWGFSFDLAISEGRLKESAP